MSELTQGIDWGTELPSTSVSYYFAPGGDTGYTPAGVVTSVTWSSSDIQQFELAFEIFETFTNLEFVETTDPEAADFTLVAYSDPASDTLGAMAPPGTVAAGTGAFNTAGDGWSSQ